MLAHQHLELPMELLDLADAVRLLAEKIAPLNESDRVPVTAALGRVTAQTETAPRDIPAFANSAMDGYAIRFAETDFNASPPYLFRRIGTSFAGRGFAGTVAAGETVRVFTGAPLPEGCDTVVIQENVRAQDARDAAGNTAQTVELLVRPARADWVRNAGHDLNAGATIFAAGCALAPQHLGLATAAGLTELAVVRRPRIAIFSNGDELIEPGTALAPGQIYDSNRVTLAALLARLPVTVIDLGRAADNLGAINAALDRARDAHADLVLCSGGVSVGDADLVREVVAARGSIEFWKIALKPGKPLAFARLGDAWFIGLPGNPVSTFITFLTVVRPAIDRLCGIAQQSPVMFPARLQQDIHREAGRLELQRGYVTAHADGSLEVRNTGNQSSGMLSSICAANCFIWLPRTQGDVRAGETVSILPFAGYL